MKRTPLRRKTRMKQRGKRGSRYPHRRSPEYMAHLSVMLQRGWRCDCGCGKRATDRAHLIPVGRGGDDRGNVVLLARACHREQEKNTGAFCIKRNRDLYAIAEQHDAAYEGRTELPW